MYSITQIRRYGMSKKKKKKEITFIIKKIDIYTGIIQKYDLVQHKRAHIYISIIINNLFRISIHIYKHAEGL